MVVGLDEETPDVLTQIGSLKAQHDRLRTVILADRLNLDEMMRALDAGASAYLLGKQLTIKLLVNTLELVCLGQIVLPGLVLQPAKNASENRPGNGTDDRMAPAPPATNPAPRAASRLGVPLSGREQRIVQQLVHGASNKHIARDLNLAEATVKVHLKAIMRKIGARNRTQAAIWAVNHPG